MAAKTIATHSGSFHADDCLAYAILELAGLTRGARLVRTRDAATIERADIVFDVGGVFDAGRLRFDHHQRGAPLRDDGTPYSAAGLVWRHYGAPVIGNLLERDELGHAREIMDQVTHEFIRPVDLQDNGIQAPQDSIGLSGLVSDRNLAWNDPGQGKPDMEDAAFLSASTMVKDCLLKRIHNVRAQYQALDAVADQHARSGDPRILELYRHMPWQDAVLKQGLDSVLFAVYPGSDGTWIVDAMPPSPGSYGQRQPLPEAWAGLRDAALAQASGIPDAVFVHQRRFIGGAGSKAGAMAIARAAIEMGLEPATGTPGI